MFAGLENNFIPASKETPKPLSARKEAAKSKALSAIPLSQHIIRLEDRKLSDVPKVRRSKQTCQTLGRGDFTNGVIRILQGAAYGLCICQRLTSWILS
eukprot:1194873-Prorocentrum_minimum.AAC.10